MEQSTSWEANSFSDSQETPRTSWNPEVLYGIHRSLPPVTVLSQINPVHAPTSHFLKINLNIILHLHLGLLGGLFPSGFPHQNPVYTSPVDICATCPTHLILLKLITWITFGEEYRPQSASLCSLLHSPVALSLLGPKILPSTSFSNTINLQLKRKTVEKQKRLKRCPLPTSMESQQCQMMNLKIGSCTVWQNSALLHSTVSDATTTTTCWFRTWLSFSSSSSVSATTLGGFWPALWFRFTIFYLYISLSSFSISSSLNPLLLGQAISVLVFLLVLMNTDPTQLIF